MTSSSALGATIRIFLVDGSPQGLRVIERIGRTGACLAFARSDYAKARVRPEVSRTGVYVLLGPDPNGGDSRIYIGEADEVRTRLDAHQKEKDFWTHAFVLSTNDESLNKAHVRYLEARLIALARQTQVSAIDNATTPPLPRLAEPEIADMESFLANALVQLTLAGVEAFDAPTQGTASVVSAAMMGTDGADSVDVRRNEAPSPASAPAGIRYFLRTAKTEAEGVDDARGFIVLEGALARQDTRTMTSSYGQLRQRLVDEGVFVPYGDGQLRLMRTYTFDSPSAAASVLTSSSRNGRIDWKDADGRTLADNQSRSAT